MCFLLFRSPALSQNRDILTRRGKALRSREALISCLEQRNRDCRTLLTSTVLSSIASLSAVRFFLWKCKKIGRLRVLLGEGCTLLPPLFTAAAAPLAGWRLFLHVAGLIRAWKKTILKPNSGI